MRKVLSFVLVLALVLSSFSMAFAADTKAAAGLTDVAGNANEDAIQVAYDLGIVTGNPDGTFLPSKAVNRAEFAAMLTRALDIPDSALSGYTTTSFKDTAGYTWAVPYLAFCQSKGILLGDGAGNVMPGRTITVNEAMTMALRAIGYTANSSLLVGTWPANYVSIAQNESLYDDVAKDTTVNKASAAQIIYNLLTVQKVAVNTDGTTDYLWKDKKIESAANLLNTNLGCTEHEKEVLGDNYTYSNSIINITDKIGAYGTAYTNDDKDLVAFKVKSTALTGKIDKDQFKVGDTKYDFGTNNITTSAVALANTKKINASSGAILDNAKIASFAAVYADGGKTVTLNVDLSGKKIKDVYSVVAWKAEDAAKADSDVQNDIADKELLGNKFAENDNKEIDVNSFDLVGVASLDKIAKDNVVYVYTDNASSSKIRKVVVGTQTLEGTIDEINDDGDVITVGGKDYDVANVKNTYEFGNSDVDSNGTVYLDGYGKAFDFDGKSKTNTYGVVKFATAGDGSDNFKVKLYKSDDSTASYFLSKSNPDKIDWTSKSATTLGAVTKGALIGYSLNSSGQMDAINNTATSATTLKFVSTKVLGSKTIASDCVVFTYKGAYNTASADDFDVASLGDIDAGTNVATTTQPALYILNKDGKVAAMFINEDFASKEDDAIYGVINTRTATTTDGDDVYKFTGLIDGKEFSYKTTDRSNEGTASSSYSLTKKFGVYGIVLDSKGAISKINELVQYAPNVKITASGQVASGIVEKLESDNTIITIGTYKYTADDKAVVYKYDTDDNTYTAAKLSSIDKQDTVAMYDTKGKDADGIATVVIYIEK